MDEFPELPVPLVDPEKHVYEARVRRVVDGDTADVRFDLTRQVDLGFHLSTTVTGSFKERVRLIGVNTPELKSSDPEERKRAVDAHMFVDGLIAFKHIRIHTEKTGSFKRWLAHIWFQNDVSKEWNHLNHLLLLTRHAELYKKK